MAAHLGSLSRDVEIGKRDAVHVPVVLVTCDEELSPSQKVKFEDAAPDRR